VYLKEPMGCSTINGRRVYGRFYAYGSFGSTNLPRSVFLKHKDILEEIEISQEWLLEKTGKHFPCAFKTSELYLLDFDVIIDIAKLLGIEYIKSRKPTSAEQGALRRAIVNKIDSL
jgi:hypothetical protein